MAKRRTSGVQRRERASTEALNRRLDTPSGMNLPDWRLLAIGGVLLVGVILIVLVLALGGEPDPRIGRQIEDDGNAHVSIGVDCRAEPSGHPNCGTDPYSSLPATSGPHWDPSGVANWGVYADPQPETQLIHNLEHGGIVIWYDAERLDADGIAALEQYVSAQNASGLSGRFKFIVTPWGGADPLPAPVVATAWNWLLELETADTAAIDTFAGEHYGIAPEPNGGPGPPG
jgi:Protein of unknown function (DUF3105)